MSDDVPAQITLFPPTVDVETSFWVGLAPTLWHAGFIWRDYEQVVFDSTPIELRLWCTFTDRRAFDTWREDERIVRKYPEILASRIEIVEAVTPESRHDRLCRCHKCSAYLLTSHGFGNRKAILCCADCGGYLPNYRVIEIDSEMYGDLQSWSLVFGHVYDIWMLTNDLEDWALREMADPESSLNQRGRELAKLLSERSEKRVWYVLYVPSEQRTSLCPICKSTGVPANWNSRRHLCEGCGIAFLLRSG